MRFRFRTAWHIAIVQDTCRMGVWLGWHICYSATQVSQGQLRENRNLSLSIRAKAVLIYVLSVPVHNGISTCPSLVSSLANLGSSCVKARPSDPLVYVWILWFFVNFYAARLVHNVATLLLGSVRFSARKCVKIYLPCVNISLLSTSFAVCLLQIISYFLRLEVSEKLPQG